ncbi:hypothetical protein MSAN_00565100 [Mycena sanguinolenta]|uniref:Uncharacterized protein n=1 Tax=Mycena sanguinolenta TaxID=230812 RepID=A0A8H6Z9Q4_9AGAR|nr:hypothetical protein MSAN_00565100 [Mycena sanguinolenta]
MKHAALTSCSCSRRVHDCEQRQYLIIQTTADPNAPTTHPLFLNHLGSFTHSANIPTALVPARARASLGLPTVFAIASGSTNSPVCRRLRDTYATGNLRQRNDVAPDFLRLGAVIYHWHIRCAGLASSDRLQTPSRLVQVTGDSTPRLRTPWYLRRPCHRPASSPFVALPIRRLCHSVTLHRAATSLSTANSDQFFESCPVLGKAHKKAGSASARAYRSMAAAPMPNSARRHETARSPSFPSYMVLLPCFRFSASAFVAVADDLRLHPSLRSQPISEAQTPCLANGGWRLGSLYTCIPRRWPWFFEPLLFKIQFLSVRPHHSVRKASSLDSALGLWAYRCPLSSEPKDHIRPITSAFVLVSPDIHFL